MLVEGPKLCNDVVLPEDPHERVQVPNLEELLLLLEHEVVKLAIKRDDEVLADQVGPEDCPVPEKDAFGSPD